MTARPILFNAAMVRALLAGTKTQTRRAMNPQPIPWGGHGGWQLPDYCASHEASFRHGAPIFKSKFGKPGDRLWVRETWGFTARVTTDSHERWMRECDRTYMIYRASSGDDQAAPWRPSIHMPRWASRITLEITDVRVDRLQDIGAQDAWAEGIPHSPDVDPAHEYRELWESINGPGSWGANPLVWRIEFRRIAP